MNFDQAKKDISSWMTNFVEVPNPSLGGWAPCPYAQQARLNDVFDIRKGGADPYTDLRRTDMGHWQVIAYVYDPDKFSAAEFDQQIREVNLGFLLPKEMIGLADHPASVETVRGVVMNQGTWAIAFVQPLKALDHFARLLAKQGYYNGWSEDYLQDLFEGREDPRS